MKRVIFVALCAIFTCHSTDATHRSKRTIGMLENFINRVRETFNPTEPPPPEVILATKLPYGFKYTYYPTVRMHIRPIQKHVIYMKEIQAPVLRHPPLPIAPNDAEILRSVRPLIRLPKTKTTTTIHYEIIPMPLHVQSPATAASAQISESEEEGRVPWTLEELPPPVPTQPVDPAEEPMVPWQMHALPPPVATKRPKGQPQMEWLTRPIQHVVTPDGFIMPLVKKKLLIPGQMTDGKSHYQQFQPPRMYFGPNDVQFVPSPLHSEISVEPSVEVTAFSEHDPVVQDPRGEYLNYLHDRGPQTFQQRQSKPRLRRDISLNFPVYIKSDNFSASLDNIPMTSSQIQTQEKNENHTMQINLNHVTPIAFQGQQFSKQLQPFSESNSDLKDSEKSANYFSLNDNANPQQIFSDLNFQSPSNGNPNAMLDFGEYQDNGEADDEDRSANGEYRESKPNYTNNLVTIVKAPEWFSETAADSFVAITPRPVNYTRNYKIADKPKTASSGIFELKYSNKPENFKNVHLFENANYEDQRNQFQRNVPHYFDSSKRGLRFPETGLFSKFPKRKENNYRNLFQDTKTSPFSNHFMGSGEDKRSRFRNNENDRNFQGFDYDNIEYFEPIVIDIDKEKQKADFGPKLKFKYKSSDKTKTGHESLRLPDNLHETVDYLQKTLMHPPIFDLEGESNEPKIIAIMNRNEIT